MKGVLGPHLDAMLRPIYQHEITEEEAERLPSMDGDFPLRVLSRFFTCLEGVLKSRFRVSVKTGEEYEQLLELNKVRPDLLFYAKEPYRNIQEALGTSIGAPIKIASWISGLEKPKATDGYPVRNVYDLTEIMQRESFGEILMRLTKGPNEFLGKGSDRYDEDELMWFYAFKKKINRLKPSDAFDMEDGKVVGLSDAYAIAAERRRRTLELTERRHQGNDSSGCPVRHGFEDASGVPQDPLIVTATKFVEGALKRAEQIPLESALPARS